MLTEDQKKLLLEILLSQGFQGIRNGKYVTRVGASADIKRAFKNLDFPEALKSHKAELADVIIDFHLYIPAIQELMQGYSDQKFTKKVSKEKAEKANDLNGLIKSLYPVIDVTGKGRDKIILVSPITDRPVYGIDLDVYLIKNGLKEQEILGSSDVITVKPYFNPYSLEPLIEKYDNELDVVATHLNTYVPPKWRYAEVEPKFEGFIYKLINHLFPIPEEREDVLDWMHYAITRRNGTILCLAGPRGTGKSLLMSILAYLVGENYSEYVNKEILEEKFNSAFKNKRLIIFEEVEVANNTAINRLKALANNRIVLEEKGEDSQTIDNFTSMAILMNDISQLRIESQDRRFSVPKVADHDLRTVIPEKEIQDFNDELSMGEGVFLQVAAFGEWLLRRKPKRSFMYAIKGDYYYFLCTMAIAEWKNFIIEYIKDRGEEGVPIPTKKIAAAFKAKYSSEEGGKSLKFPDRAQTFELFLKDYKHRGDYYVGTFVKEFDDNSGKEINAILPNPDFLEYIEKEKMKNVKKRDIDPMEAL